MKFWYLLSLIVTCAISAGLSAEPLEIGVSLSPAGSFVAKTAAVAVKGGITRNGDGFAAKNIVADLTTLKTGIELRDKHMKETYLETKKFPEAVLTQATGTGGKFSGELVVRKVPKAISGTYEVSGNKLTAKFNVNASDFQVSKASYMGVGVEDSVEVTVELPLASK